MLYTAQKAAGGLIPRNTEFTTHWALRNFSAWAKHRCELVPDDPVPADLLCSKDPVVVCKYLRFYILETRKEDGTAYPPVTLRSLLSGLNRILQKNGTQFSVLDKSDLRFRELLNTLDVVSSALHKEGIGSKKKSAGIIDVEHENMFWEKKLLGYLSPRALQHAVFGLHFALRGVQKQYDLVPHQFVRFPTDVAVYDRNVYT